ncbi:hypothetical protein GS924_25070 [Rhodococcus hoagii]|nr:hypothetical protein [Prescottella equi]
MEAAKVVERVLYFAEHHPGESLGVVTFSSAQADAVQAEIERQSAAHPVLADLLGDHDRLDGFFVKSLENVQGDERDVIIFSLGYGPDENGKFTMNFGPLNRDGGWRRLNVAITRARQRVEIVSSFRAADMSGSSNEAIRHLKNYLDFAERGQKALALDLEDSLGDVESPFEEQVIDRIRSWGYEVVRRWVWPATASTWRCGIPTSRGATRSGSSATVPRTTRRERHATVTGCAKQCYGILAGRSTGSGG